MQTTIEDFVNVVWEYYAKHARVLPWRLSEPNGQFDPYKIVVSELMLQQTQVARVIPKYTEFLQLFPNVSLLAKAPLGEVLKTWSGLGYNRRAKFLWQTAQAVMRDFTGVFPETKELLQTLSGIGPNTAGAICAYAYNQPTVFIETNIRSVFIHHFFHDRQEVDDKEIIALVDKCIRHLQAQQEPHFREWYWALMDYGTHIKATVGNTSRASKHYVKQSTFAGSRRQLRGQVLRALATQPSSQSQLQRSLSDERLTDVLHDLQQEGFITARGGKLHLA